MWRVIEKEIISENKSIISYGIGGDCVEIHDISTHKIEIESFVEQLNRLEASEIHAYELVEDYLGK